MSWIMIDIEADGPIPGDYSMVSFGAVAVEPGLSRRFQARLRPISERWLPEALAISGLTCEQTLAFDDAAATMQRFADWLATLGSLYKGLVKDTRQNFKHLRRTPHTHNPLDDALGNAEALLHMHQKMGLHLSFGSDPTPG